MKIFAVLFFVCAIVGFSVAATSSSGYAVPSISEDSTTYASGSASTTTLAPAASEPQGPCGQGRPGGLPGQKLYYFF